MATLSDYQFLVADIMAQLNREKGANGYLGINKIITFADELIIIHIDSKKRLIRVTGLTYGNVPDVFHLLKEQGQDLFESPINQPSKGNSEVKRKEYQVSQFNEKTFEEFIKSVPATFPVAKLITSIGWNREIILGIHEGKFRDNCRIFRAIDINQNGQVDLHLMSSIVMQVVLYTLRLQSESLARQILNVDKQLSPHLPPDVSQMVGQFLFD